MCTADGSLRVWDSAQPSHNSAVCVGVGGAGEVLACDWNKYDHHSIVTAGVDATVRYIEKRNRHTIAITS